MPRVPRFYSDTSYFHVMTQGIKKEFIFNQPQDAKRYISILYNTKDECKINIIAYCIMNNHAHLLLKALKIENLSKFMQKVNGKYAKFYNKKYERVGYVFRDRFKSEGIYTEQNLHNCVAYIYNNPVKAGICNSPEEYPFSNYKYNRNMNYETCEEYDFIDTQEDKEKQCENLVNEYMKKEKQFNTLLEQQASFKKLIMMLQNNYKTHLEAIERCTGISKSQIKNIIW